jgi:predicted alpha/beta-fold hydrolase
MSTECKVTEQLLPQNLTHQNKRPSVARSGARPALIEIITRELEAKPFKPHPKFTTGHAQTLAAYYWPRGFLKRAHRRDQTRIFEVEPTVRLLAHCRWQQDKLAHPTMILVHGLEGANTSVYMLGTAEKAFRAGFNVVRLNLRTCGKTEHLTPTFYHSALTDDLRAVVHELTKEDGLSSFYLVGFSMGGNMSLMLAGEEAKNVPHSLKGVCAVSPTIDLNSCADAIEQRSNWLYKQSFMRSMRKRVRRKRKYFPELYDTKALSRVHTIREFDQHYTVVYGGYQSVDEYYERASSLPLLSEIRTPTLMIHAQDDPFVPFAPFRHPSIAENPCLIFLAPEHGGHVGFVGAGIKGEDRFWVENRVVEFCKLISERLATNPNAECGLWIAD